MSFDHLNLAKDDKVRTLLHKHGECYPADEIILYSNTITKINKKSKPQQRVLAITDKAIYNFTPTSVKSRTFSIRNVFGPTQPLSAIDDNKNSSISKSKSLSSVGALTSVGALKRRIKIKQVHTISISAIVNEFVLHVPSEYDYYYRTSNKTHVEQIVRTLEDAASAMSVAHHIKTFSIELGSLSQISNNHKTNKKKHESDDEYMLKKMKKWEKIYKIKKYQIRSTNKTKVITKSRSMNNNNNNNNNNYNQYSPLGRNQQPKYFNVMPNRPTTPNMINTKPKYQQQVPVSNHNNNNNKGFPDPSNHSNMQYNFVPPNNNPPANAVHANQTQLLNNAHRGYSQNFINNPYAMQQMQHAQHQAQHKAQHQAYVNMNKHAVSSHNLGSMQYMNNNVPPPQLNNPNQFNKQYASSHYNVLQLQQQQQQQQQRAFSGGNINVNNTQQQQVQQQQRALSGGNINVGNINVNNNNNNNLAVNNQKKKKKRKKSQKRSISSSRSSHSSAGSFSQGTYNTDTSTDYQPTPSPQPSQASQPSHKETQSQQLPQHTSFLQQQINKFYENEKTNVPVNGSNNNNLLVNNNNNSWRKHQTSSSAQLPNTNKFPINKKIPKKALPSKPLPNKPVPINNNNNNYNNYNKWNNNNNNNRNNGYNNNNMNRNMNTNINNMNNMNMNNSNGYNTNMNNMNNVNNAANMHNNVAQNNNNNKVSTLIEAQNMQVKNKEFYLNDTLFWQTFKMTKDEFYKLRPWKQKQLKRNTGLF